MLAEMQKKMEKEMTDRLEKEMSQMTNRLEREMEKSNGLAEKTNRLEREMEAERNKTSKLEREIKEERKKRSLLEVDVDDLKQSTNDIADWIVAGVCYLSIFVFFCSLITSLSAILKTVVNPFDEFRSAIF